jgi:hypothetical protein
MVITASGVTTSCISAPGITVTASCITAIEPVTVDGMAIITTSISTTISDDYRGGSITVIIAIIVGSGCSRIGICIYRRRSDIYPGTGDTQIDACVYIYLGITCVGNQDACDKQAADE